MQNVFDPVTGQRLKAVPPAPNNRRMLYHPDGRPPIIVEPEGMAAALEDGYVKTIPHGQHPHSMDKARIDMQKKAAAKGDKYAKAALEAKGVIPSSAKDSAKNEEPKI